MGKPADDQAHNTVTTDSKGVVVTVLRGKQTADDTRALAVELLKHTQALRAQGKKVLLLTNIHFLKISDSTSEARLEGKKLLDLPSDASAVVGNPGVMSMAMYMLRITNNNANIRFFTSERQARAWLEGLGRPQRPRPSVSMVSGIIIALIGLAALMGWYMHNPYLRSGVPSLKPMNPIAALGLVVTGYGFICYWLGKLKQLKLAGVFGIVIGVLALLTSISHALFGDHVVATSTFAQTADSAGLCFIAVGLSPFTVGTKKLFVRVFQYVLGATIISLSLFNIFGQLYAHDFIYGIGGSFVMAFNLAVAFFIVGCTLVVLVLYKHVGNIFGGVTRIGWLLVASLIFVQVAAYGAWTQAVTHNKANSSSSFIARGDEIEAVLGQRVQAYKDALYGFKGLFVSSDFVDQGEFQAYYNSINLSTTYPGLRALSFISKVQEKDLPAFVAKHRADTSLYPGGNPGFAITAKSASTTHYIVTYSATSATPGGSDLGSTPSRLVAFQKADATGVPVSSGTLAFAASQTSPATKGFFITIPTSSKGSYKLPGHPTIGFVNAVFDYRSFFAHTFTSKSILGGINASISDTMDHVSVYSSSKGGPEKDTAFSRLITVPVADHTWDLRLSAPNNFGISSSQSVLPRTILIGGQIFSLLLFVIFVLQTRARRQGFELADSLTEDLANERNRAVASDQKSSAILSSIGDAVFAVDTKQRITLFNPSAQHISGYTEAEVLGKKYDEVLKFELEKNGRPNNSFVHRALAGHLASMSNHTVLVRKDGTRVPVADSAAPIHDAKHNIEGAIVVFRDVTRDYQLDKAKTEFVSLASHQLRTPLSAINWFGEMLLNGDAGKLNKAQREYMNQVFDSNKRMIDLVNSLLDVSRLEVGKLAGKPVSTDITALIDSLQKELAVGIREKHLEFVANLRPVPQVVADPKQLRMIIQNLMSNAVKYTPAKGSVSVTLRPAKAADLAKANLHSTGQHWYFSVQDTGYGIPKDAQPKIFAKLYRADNVQRLNVEGTGLGLYIVKEIVEKMGGRVWFESTEGAGTTFYVVAPLYSGGAS